MENWEQYKPKQPFFMAGGWVRNWFSNMALSEIEIDGITWPSVENYYQAMKSLDRNFHLIVATMNPRHAKAAGRGPLIVLRKDWEGVKYSIMKQGLWVKFMIPEWRDKLLATGNEMIIEWNNWNDKIWGVSIHDCKGQNLLGKALMEIRVQLIIEQSKSS